MELRINHQFPQLGLRIQKANMNMVTIQPQIQLSRRPAELQIVSPRPKIHIDQSQCFADAGLRSPERFTAYWVSEGQSKFAEAVQRIVSEGDQLAKINKTSVADIAKSRSDKTVETNVKAIPQQPPEVSFDISPVQINYVPVEIKLDVRMGQVQNNYQPGSVDIYEQQAALLEINWVGSNYDQTA